MTFSVRSCLTTGVAAVTAVAITAAPTIPTPVAHSATVAQVRVVEQPVRLTAAVQPAVAPSAAALPNLLTDWVRTLVPSSAAAFPTPQFPPRVGGNSISSGIKNVYNAVEPWVQWGFEVAEYAVGWIPVVGWLSPQIMIFYNLGERIVRSITFNIADWIGGSVSFLQGLRNVARDTINSFIYFANDELAFFLPPLPPIPPIGGALAAATAEPTALKLATATDTSDAGTEPTTADTVTKVGTVTEETKTPAAEPVKVTEPAVTEETPVTEPVTTPETPAAEPETTPEVTPDVKDVVKDDAPETAPDTTKPDTTKPDTTDTKPDTSKPDTPKADTPKADTDKPAPKRAEPKKKKRDHRASTPKADTHAAADAG